jgi:Tripartite tricarboxylate transporter TctB family
MTLRSDHVAGAAFVAFGALVIALSGDLPTGRLSMPGSGFLPKIVAALTILFGLVLIVRAGESAPFAEVSWGDVKHALMVTAITALAILLYTRLGFIITMAAMMIALLVVIERRKPVYAAAYSVAIVLLTYVSFEYLLKTPMPLGPFNF